MSRNTNTDLRNGVNGDVGCKYPCEYATTANITLEGIQNIDGGTGAEYQKIFVKDQTDQTENGVYIQSSGEWERGVWFNNQLNVAPGTLVVVNGGTVNAKTIWETVCADNPIEFGTSNITFQLKVKGTNTGDKSVSLTGPITGSSTEVTPGILTIPTSITDDSVTTSKILDNNVTNAKLAQVASGTFKGRTTASTGNVEDLTGTQATALLVPMVGDSGSGGTKGLVPAPVTGDATKFLRGDGAWGSPAAVPAATETVAGIAELATQAETNAGTNDSTITTPLKLTAAGGLAFARAYANFRDVKTTGTPGGSYTSAGVWQTRDLNTVVVNEIGASLATNQFTLLAGTYYIEAQVTMFQIDDSKLRIQNITDTSTALEGINQTGIGTSNFSSGINTMKGRFTLAATKTLALQQIGSVAKATIGLGKAISLGSNETFAEIVIWKLY